MSTEKRVERVKNILLQPHTEWPVIAAESDTVGGLYSRYILLLAAIPAVAGFLKGTFLGTSVPMMGTIRVGVGTGLTSAVLQYIVGLISVYVLALIINALAPTFGGQKDSVQALKTSAYASTAAWVTGALILVPWLGALLALAGGCYSFYLLYLGLPATMRNLPEKSKAYTVVTVICAIVLSLVFGALTASIAGMGAFHQGVEVTSDEGTTTKVDPESALGKLEALSKKMEAAGKKMDEAEKSGDQQAQIKAAGAALGTLFSGGDNVESLKSEELKAFVPDKLGGLERKEYSAERNTVMGLQTTSATAKYSDGGARSLQLEITDMGGTKGLASLASWAVQESERQSDSGYERSYHKDGRMVHEQWTAASRSGSYTQIIGERFSVELEGKDVDMDELRKLSETLDLPALEKLRTQGVKPAES